MGGIHIYLGREGEKGSCRHWGTPCERCINEAFSGKRCDAVLRELGSVLERGCIAKRSCI